MFSIIIYQGDANKSHSILTLQTNRTSHIKNTENFKWRPKRMTTRIFTHCWRDGDRALRTLENWPYVSLKVKENSALKAANSTPHKETLSTPSVLMYDCTLTT